jgi:hypothetical protein
MLAGNTMYHRVNARSSLLCVQRCIGESLLLLCRIVGDSGSICAETLKREQSVTASPGVGKTALAQAIGYEAIKAGFIVFYRSIFDLVRDFLKDEAFNQEDRTLRQYLKPDLLIIDDMGLKALPKHSGEYLLEVVMRRHENRSTIMTSNRPLEEWGKLLNDVPTAGAILDRFLHHAQLIAITGRSYRVKDVAAHKEPSKQKPTKATADENSSD